LPAAKLICHIAAMDKQAGSPSSVPIVADPRLDQAALAALRQRGLSDAAIRRALASLKPTMPPARDRDAP